MLLPVPRDLINLSTGVTMATHCTQCDTNLPDNAKFCPACGKQITSEVDESASSDLGPYRFRGAYYGSDRTLSVECTLIARHLLIESEKGFSRQVRLGDIIKVEDRSRRLFGEQVVWVRATGGNFFLYFGAKPHSSRKMVKTEFLSRLQEAMGKA